MSSQQLASFLLLTGTAGTMTKTLEPCKTHSGIFSAPQRAQVSAGVSKPPPGLGVCIGMPLVNGTGNSPSPGRPTPGVVKRGKSSGGSVGTTKTRPDPQRVRMSSGERPIGTAKGSQPNTEALYQRPPPPPPPVVLCSEEAWAPKTAARQLSKSCGLTERAPKHSKPRGMRRTLRRGGRRTGD